MSSDVSKGREGEGRGLLAVVEHSFCCVMTFCSVFETVPCKICELTTSHRDERTHYIFQSSINTKLIVRLGGKAAG